MSDDLTGRTVPVQPQIFKVKRGATRQDVVGCGSRSPDATAEPAPLNEPGAAPGLGQTGSGRTLRVYFFSTRTRTSTTEAKHRSRMSFSPEIRYTSEAALNHIENGINCAVDLEPLLASCSGTEAKTKTLLRWEYVSRTQFPSPN